MKQVSYEEIKKRLESRKAKGHKVDARLFEEIKNAKALFLITLEDEEYFMSLIWQSIEHTRFLTPVGESRTLRDIVQRMVENSWTFEALSSKPKKYGYKYDPDWFISAEKIYSEFDIDIFDLIAVQPANESEQKESPNGTFYIFDGVHRTLVLAYKLVSLELNYKPIEAVLLVPRVRRK